MALLIALFLALVLVLSVLAIYASTRIRQLDGHDHPVEQPSGNLTPQKIAEIGQRLESIEKRLAALEAHAARSQSPAQITSPADQAGHEDAPSPAAPPRHTVAGARSVQSPTARKVILPPAPVASKKRSRDLESLVAERWLNYFGILAILFAAAFFIKYTFDNHWVGPRGRVEVGLLAGALVLLWSERLVRLGYRYFSEGMAGLGASVLYVSIWGGWHYYHLFAANAALAAMAVVTAATAAIAIWRDSQRLIVMALAGGFLSPLLLSTGNAHETVLFGYNAVLAAGMLGVERVRRWSWLPLLTFFFVELYFWGWYTGLYSRSQLWPTLGFATLFFLIFAALPTLRGRRSGRLTGMESAVVAANACCYLGALWILLRPDHRWLLVAAFLALAVAYWAERRALARESSTLRRLMGALALLSATLAIPARLDHQWLTMAWAVEAAAVVWTGARAGSWRQRAAGMILLGVVGIRLLASKIPAHVFLWNARLGTFAVCVGCFAVAAAALPRSTDGTLHREKTARAILLTAVSAYSLLALSLEIWDLFGRLPLAGMEHRAAQQMALSVLWTLAATGLIALGIAKRSALLRWEALTLFALTVGKVFLHDLASLERIYRILSFLVLGILLLAVSFIYQRRAMAQKTAHASHADPTRDES